MKKILAIGFLLLTVGMLITGCAASQEQQLNLAYTAIPLTQTRIAMDAPSPTPMPAVLEFAVAVEQAKATAGAVEATQIWIYGQLTATQAAKDEAATRQASVATQQAFILAATATHEAFAANQASTERAWNATVTSQVQGTATAYPMTATARADHATQTEQAWQATATMASAYGAAQATAAYGDSESVNLSIQRERVTNMTRAWLPWMGFVVTLALIAVMGYRWSKVRVIPRDPFGALPGLVMNGVFKDPDRLPGPDAATTARAQVGQMVRSLPAGRKLEDVPQFDGTSSRPQIDVVNAEVVQEWVTDVSQQADEREV